MEGGVVSRGFTLASSFEPCSYRASHEVTRTTSRHGKGHFSSSLHPAKEKPLPPPAQIRSLALTSTIRCQHCPPPPPPASLCSVTAPLCLSSFTRVSFWCVHR
ncbi:hypothetical protein E2C01_066332 [Portunus trituberculatus]|uniref:Uncharacterized protein n=2 Tax=Portunus trituberculatus TaxID=210409 RepID=A0A5B7HQM9_PORTR|nr:hypothetical protein [Portunus trituberculatus]